MFRRRNTSQKPNAGQWIFGLLVVALVVMGLFILARGIFGILQLLAPVLLIATAIINWRVIPWYIKTVFNWLKHNTVVGIIAVVFTILGFPLVVAFLFAKALLERKSGRSRMPRRDQRERPGDYIDYEELEEEPLELPRVLRTREKE